MNQIICDACGNVIKNQPDQQYSEWSTNSSGVINIIQQNLDICQNCWKKISKGGKGS